VAAQVESRWFPRVEPFQPLIATPREVQVRASFVYADRSIDDSDPLYAGGNLEAEVAVGHRLEIYRFDDGSSPGRAATIGIEMGIFSRFFMEAREKDLINSDFRIGFPFSVRSGPWESRITLRHVSSHLGDDYFTRFPDELFGQTSKDGFEGLLARRFGENIRVYAGGDYNFHTNDEMSRGVLRFGGEWEPVEPGDDNGSWPVFATDIEWASFSKAWGATLIGGMAFRVNGRRIRLEARARLGSTPMGYFRDADETFFGLGFALDL
jgi:hypothetical protein